MEKILFLLVDGIGDCTIPAFGDRTPLEVAHVPFLDAIAGIHNTAKKETRASRPELWNRPQLLHTYCTNLQLLV
jgi:hypothetical protein